MKIVIVTGVPNSGKTGLVNKIIDIASGRDRNSSLRANVIQGLACNLFEFTDELVHHRKHIGGTLAIVEVDKSELINSLIALNERRIVTSTVIYDMDTLGAFNVEVSKLLNY